MTVERIAYRADEAAEALGVDLETVRRWLAAGELPGRKVPARLKPAISQGRCNPHHRERVEDYLSRGRGCRCPSLADSRPRQQILASGTLQQACAARPAPICGAPSP